MAIREDLVASATQFLQDPSVANSSVENRVSFLRTKNLTQEEIDVALARVGVAPGATASPTAAGSPVAGPPVQQQQYYPQSYPPQYAAWQAPPPVPKRDWRDWFIMATVVGGVSYGVYALTKRYVYPLIAPPTPERLEQDKKSVEEQFDKAFGLVEQLAKDTESLKMAERERTERLDTALSDFEAVINELKSANRRRDDEAQRIRDDIYNLKDAVPKAMDTQKDLTDQRLREINTELTSLKTLISQRMSSAPTTAAPAPGAAPSPVANGHSRPASGSVSQSPGLANVNTNSPGSTGNDDGASATPITGGNDASATKSQAASAKPYTFAGTGGKASIPAWQMAMANKGSAGSASGPASPAPSAGEGGSGAQNEAGNSS